MINTPLTTFSIREATRVIGLLYHEGLCYQTMSALVPQYPKEDHLTYQHRTSIMLAPNLLKTTLQTKCQLATSLYTINGLDTKILSEMLLSCFAYGGFYLSDSKSDSKFEEPDNRITDFDNPFELDSIETQELITPYQLYSKLNVFGGNRDKLKGYKLLVTNGTNIPIPPYKSILPQLGSFYGMACTLAMAIEIGSFPILVRKGAVTLNEDERNLFLNPYSVIELRNPDADAHWLTNDGQLHKVMMDYLERGKNELENELGLTWLKGMIDSIGKSATASLVTQQIGISHIDSVINMIADFMRNNTGGAYEIIDFTQVNIKQNQTTTDKPTGPMSFKDK